jgi:hypothetical protein
MCMSRAKFSWISAQLMRCICTALLPEILTERIDAEAASAATATRVHLGTTHPTPSILHHHTHHTTPHHLAHRLQGFEIGSGFSGSRMIGSEHNDEFFMGEDGQVRTRSNRSGGVQGGISNGEDIVIRVAFKPTSTIGIKQKTVTREGEEVRWQAGRLQAARTRLTASRVCCLQQHVPVAGTSSSNRLWPLGSSSSAMPSKDW